MKDVVNEYYPGGGGELVPASDQQGQNFAVVGANVVGNPVVGDIIEGPNITGIVTILGIVEQNPQPANPEWVIATDAPATQQWLAINTYTFNKNPYFDTTYQGDPDFLTGKIVRFSYRFQFEDNTYSLMAPYTQEAFIPKQDGYFLNETAFDDPTTSVNEDQEQAYRSTIVDFMDNKVNKIT